MHIVYHFRVRGSGAESVHIAGIAGGFVHFGHELTFVSPSGVNPLEPQQQSRPPSLPTLLLHRVADRAPQLAFECMELLYNAQALPRLLKRLRSTNASLLYERYAFFNIAGALAHLRTGVPLVLEINELAGHERVRDQKLVSLCRALERFVLKQATLVVTVSDFLTERVHEITERSVPVLTIPNGVPTRWKQGIETQDVAKLRNELGLADKSVVLFVGKLVHWHNFPRFLANFAEVRRRVPNAVLLMVGDGPMLPEILRLREDLQLYDAVQLTGAVPHERVRQYVELADVAVVPETNDYRSPIKMFEYMAHGKAVVAPALPPIHVALEHGRSALLFEPNGSGMVEAIVRILSEPGLRRELGSAAKRRVFADFTWEGHATRILNALGTGVALTAPEPHRRARSTSQEATF